MASYSVAAGEIAAYGKVLIASTVDTVTFANDRGTVRVTNDTGTAAIFFTVDGSTPTVNGAATYRVPASVGASASVGSGSGATKTVKLISSGTPTYSVEGSV